MESAEKETDPEGKECGDTSLQWTQCKVVGKGSHDFQHGSAMCGHGTGSATGHVVTGGLWLLAKVGGIWQGTVYCGWTPMQISFGLETCTGARTKTDSK